MVDPKPVSFPKVRKTLIDDIIIKHKLVKPRIDTGRRRRKTTKKDLDRWKQKRARHLEGWKKKKKKKRRSFISIYTFREKQMTTTVRPDDEIKSSPKFSRSCPKK